MPLRRSMNFDFRTKTERRRLERRPTSRSPFSRVITNTGTSWKMETDALYNLGETNAAPRAN